MPEPTESNPLTLLPAHWRKRLPDAQVDPVSGGMCNALYRIESQGQAFALRINNPEPDRLGLDPAREARVLQAIADQPWAPEICHQDDRILLTRWVDGEPPVGGEMTRLNWLGHALAAVHRLTGPLPRIDIAAELRALARRCGADAEATQRHVDALLADYRPPRTHVLCHHDWHPGNLIIGRSGWTLLDWEFAGLGDPCLDIGSAINGFALPDRALGSLSQTTGHSVKQLRRARAIMKALEIVWYATNPHLKADAPNVLARWLSGPADTIPDEA